MPDKTNWESAETWQRVVASIIASGVKLDLKAMSLYYGTTYDTLENRFRKIKKLAATLKEEVDNGERGEVAPTRTKSAPTTPRQPKTPKKDPLSAVANGRVSKSSPSKKSGIKAEHTDSNASSFMDGLTYMGMNSFDHSDFGFTGGDGLFDGMGR